MATIKSIEEKAKAYDEALKVAEKYHNGTLKDVMETIFHELKESEDERIRKKIIDLIKEVGEDDSYHVCCFDKMIAWLEKQGEQNLAFIEKGKWYICIRTSYKPNGKDFIEGKTYYAKEDYKIIGECGEVDIATDNPEEFFRSATEEETNDIIKNFVNEQKPINKIDSSKIKKDPNPYWTLAPEYQLTNKQKPADKVEPKFKVGDRVIGVVSGMPYFITKICDDHYNTESGCIIMFCAQDNFELYEQKSSWSEDDELMIRGITIDIEELIDQNAYDETKLRKEIDWLKSLRLQSHWKPSDGQVEALRIAIGDEQGSDCCDILRSLLKDLKSL